MVMIPGPFPTVFRIGDFDNLSLVEIPGGSATTLAKHGTGFIQELCKAVPVSFKGSVGSGGFE